MNQKKIFLSTEGDKWFYRNKDYLNKKASFFEFDELLKYLKKNDKILEIGCSNGAKLNYISSSKENYNLKLFGIDPSIKAIEDGKINYKSINLSVGTSDKLNFDEFYFDVVIVGFCLYLVDRSLIFKTVSEIDRVLKANGLVFLTDFEPPYPTKIDYHHAPGVHSYKNVYSNFFTGGGHYSLISKRHYSHSSLIFDPNCNKRVSSSILYKESIEDIYKVEF